MRRLKQAVARPAWSVILRRLFEPRPLPARTPMSRAIPDDSALRDDIRLLGRLLESNAEPALRIRQRMPYVGPSNHLRIELI